MTTTQLIKTIKEEGQDFEWYPTTEEMLACIDDEILKQLGYYDGTHGHYNIMDCGAGDGRVLKALSHGGDMFAIEKSSPLLEVLDSNIFITGTNFFTSTLIDKKVDILFSNPPYSEYEQWAEKIIIEANSKLIFLVIPERWRTSLKITGALKTREATAKIIGSYNFIHAERAARAKVDIIMVDLRFNDKHYHSDELQTDPFGIWFNNQFDFTASKETKKCKNKETLKSKLEKAMVAGGGLIPSLVKLYEHELLHLQNNFTAVSRLDPDILKELDVNVIGLQKALRQKIKGLKNKYWEEFFSNYEPITNRLTSGSREKMTRLLNSQTSVDFTEDNIYAVTIWAIKNANKYFDSQLIDTVEKMIDRANIKLYKSNQRTFDREEWRYTRKPKNLSRFALELRVIVNNYGGIEGDGYSFNYHNGLHNNDHNFINDLITIAGNLGFTCYDDSRWHEWESRKKIEFVGNKGTLMQVSAFKNGNLHIKFGIDFIRTLNVEFGRLKGWLKNHKQAANEIDIPEAQARVLFKSNHQLTASNFPLLTAE